jgi:hypothetical protein
VESLDPACGVLMDESLGNDMNLPAPQQLGDLLELHESAPTLKRTSLNFSSDVHDLSNADCCGARSTSCSTHATGTRAREAVLVAPGRHRHSRPLSPAARRAWTCSGDWMQRTAASVRLS